MMFTLAKDIIEKTRIWQIIRRMPKGCLLHAHMDAMVDFDYLFEILLAEPGMHLSSPAGNLAQASDKEVTKLSFRYRTQTTPVEKAASIWTADYVPGTFVLLSAAADAFPAGGRPGFVKWLKEKCIISLMDSVEQHHGVDAIWEKFAMCFEVIGTMIHYEPIFRKFLQRLMSTLHQDGVNWVEIR
jgi:adenosine deaminase CECR1